ncbi:MAG: YbbR-like domain-containing protein [Bacilli bacterium]
MKKIIKLISSLLANIVTKIGLFIDQQIIIPITKAVMLITTLLKDNKKRTERLLTQKHSLILISLALALIMFLIVDNKANLFIESSAEVLYNQPVKAVYNEEAFVVEGIPDVVDITLIGRRADLYLAKQLPIQEVNIDLSGLKPGTHRVPIRYSHPLTSIDYKLDPSFTTIVIYPKVSVVRGVGIDLLHEEKLDPKLIIEQSEIDKTEVIIKGAQHTIDKVAVIKAMIDIENISKPVVGTLTLEDIALIAYDQKGNQVDVEIVPAKVKATIEITSPNKQVPIKIIPVGEVSFGKAIESMSADKTDVIVYADQKTLTEINYITVEIDVDKLSAAKEFNVTLKKPSGAKHISVANVTVSVTLGEEVNQEIPNIKIEHRSLADNLSVQALSAADTEISVVVKGTKHVLAELDHKAIYAYVDLSGYGVGQHEVEVAVYGDDLRATYTPKTKKVKVRIIKQ